MAFGTQIEPKIPFGQTQQSLPPFRLIQYPFLDFYPLFMFTLYYHLENEQPIKYQNVCGIIFNEHFFQAFHQAPFIIILFSFMASSKGEHNNNFISKTRTLMEKRRYNQEIND